MRSHYALRKKADARNSCPRSNASSPSGNWVMLCANTHRNHKSRSSNVTNSIAFILVDFGDRSFLVNAYPLSLIEKGGRCVDREEVRSDDPAVRAAASA